MATPTKDERRQRVLVLWNQPEEDVYEKWKVEGPQPLPWNPEQLASEVGTVEEELNAFLAAIRQNGYEVFCVNLRDDIEKALAAFTLHEPDVIFNLVEYFYDDESLEPNFPALYELYDIPYTGNRALTLHLCHNKVRTKVLLEDAGLPTAPYYVVEKEPVPDPLDYDLEYPLIVKPSREDASGGIEAESVVSDYDALAERCRYIFKEFEQPALVEEYIDGREIHAAILGNSPPEVLPLFEMEFDDSEFYPDEEDGSDDERAATEVSETLPVDPTRLDTEPLEEGDILAMAEGDALSEEDDEFRPQIISYKAKWDPHSKAFYSMDAVCPAEDLEPEVESQIKSIALHAFQVMGCRDYARVDMRVDEDNNVYILEVNPNPDLADGSAYVMCSDASGRTYSQVIGEIVKMALARRPKEEPTEPKVVSDHLLREYGSLKSAPSNSRPEGAATDQPADKGTGARLSPADAAPPNGDGDGDGDGNGADRAV